MKVLIVEDEILAQEELVRLINKHYPNFTVSSILDSVTDSIAWLKTNSVDLIFMDIHLSDGISFDIFEQVDVKTPIIFTTAYEQYAIKAFQVNGIGYLLKPIVESDLVRAVSKLNESMYTPDNLKRLLETMSAKRNYKSRITTKIGDKYTFVEMSEVAYFYSEDRVTFVVTKQNKKYIVDYTLENLESMLDPQQFFRLTRNAMASINSINNVSKYFNSRLKVTLNPELNSELLVSRVRVPDFLKWLDGE